MEDASGWVTLVQWALGNPEKGALGLVVVAGAWRWIREMMRSTREEDVKETFMETLMKERRELIEENRMLRKELSELNKGGSS